MDRFIKVEGLGNDFILLDERSRGADALAPLIERLSQAAPRCCDRRLGIGGDGILLVGPPPPPPPGYDRCDATMVVINADGSRPEMCGNGLRCVAAFVARDRETDRVRVATDAGPRTCHVRTSDSDEYEVTVEMGLARDLREVTPSAAGGRRFRALSLGNPHAVAFVAPDEDPQQLATELGPQIEVDPRFPDRTNVEFARVLGERSIELWVWERGVGLTHACGTGACATACAAAWAELVAPGPLDIHLPGGVLTIWPPASPEDPVRMRGPARFVFTGSLARQFRG